MEFLIIMIIVERHFEINNNRVQFDRAVTSIKQSPVLEGHLFIVLS
jgi:hypothetical protein